MTFFDKDSLLKSSFLKIDEKIIVHDQQEEVKFSNWGFEPEQMKEEIFDFKHFGLENFPEEQEFQCFVSNEKQFLIVTQTNRIFRWRLDPDPGCIEIEKGEMDAGYQAIQQLKQIGQFGLGLGKTIQSGFLKLGNQFKEGIQTNLLGQAKAVSAFKEKQDDNVTIESKIFLEPGLGNNAIWSIDGDNYLLNYHDNKLRYLSALKQKNINFVIWNDKLQKYGVKDILIVLDGNKFYSYSITKEQQKKDFSLERDPDKIEYTDTLGKMLLQIPDRQFTSIFKITINNQISILLVSQFGINVLYGSNNFEELLTSYKEPIKLQEALQNKSGISSQLNRPNILMDIAYFTNYGEYDYDVSHLPKQIIWSDGHNIILFKGFSVDAKQITENNFNQASLLKYKKKSDIESLKGNNQNDRILGIGITDFHYYILISDMITIVSMITKKVEQYYDLQVRQFGNAIQLIHYHAYDCFWILCERGVFKLDYSGEDKNVWELLIEEEEFQDAIRISKKYNSSYLKHIAGLYADNLFQNEKFIDSAKYYYESDRTFEEIFLQFAIKNDQRVHIALENYLKFIEELQELNHQEQVLHSLKLELMVTRLKNYQRLTQYDNDDDLELPEEFQNINWKTLNLPSSQSRIKLKNQSRDSLNIKSLRESSKSIMLQDEKEHKIDVYKIFQQFTQKQKPQQGGAISFLEQKVKELRKDVTNMLDQFVSELTVEELVYEILNLHGFFNESIHFAILKKNYEIVVVNYISYEMFDRALEKLSEMENKELSLDLIARFSYALMETQAKPTLQLVQNFNKLDPKKMIIGIINVPRDQSDLVVQFLEFCIYQRHCYDKIINNLLIFYLTRPVRLEKLMTYLNLQEKKWNERQQIDFDLHFALRIFKQLEILLPQIIIFGMQGNYDICVGMALKNNQLNVAKEYANRIQDVDIKQSQWLRIAQWMMERGGETNIRDVVLLTHETDAFKIQDILPGLSASVKFDHFKVELCDSLREQNNRIQKLKNEMEAYQQSAESLKSDLKSIHTLYQHLEQDKKCYECNVLLFQEVYILFSCTHSFHKKCLFNLIKKVSLNPDKLKRLQNQYIQLGFDNKKEVIEDDDDSFFKFGTKQTQQKIEPTKKNIQIENDFNNSLCEECPYCGIQMIDSLKYILDRNEDVAQSWEI